MEGRKLRRQKTEIKEPKKVKVKKGKEKRLSENNKNILSIISRVLIIAMTVVVIAVLGTVVYLKVLPNKYLIPLCVLVFLLIAGGIFVIFRKKELKIFRIISSIISVILIVIFSFVGLKLIKTMDFLGDMTTETVNAKTYSVVVKKDSKYAKLEDLQYRLLLYYDTELNQNKQAIDKLTEVMTIVTEKTDDVHELVNKLIAGDVDAILIEDSYYAIIEEEMADFKEKTKGVYTFALEDAIATIAKNVSVTDEPFVVYISGIDSYGKISSVARSDVNMLAVINPKTKQVLLVNTPRDYYVKLHGTSGYRDKLTHAGIYGVDMSVKTMEDLYDVDINYYVRVNFTSLIKIIDAIGGVNVYSEYDFTSRIGNYKFKKGYNQMNGKQALGFARERYSFSEGDRMRGQNQQAVIDAMIKKVCSSSTILTKFDALLDSLKGSFQTNMEYTKMIDLVRMQISDGAEWNISSVSVDGMGSKERTYSMGKTLLYVMIPYAGSVNKAEGLIDSVLEGEMLEAGNINISKYNDYPVVAKGKYETDKKEEPKEEPEEQPEVTPEPGQGTTGDNNTGDNSGNNSGDNQGTGNNNGSSENTPGSGDNTGDSTQGGGNTEDNKDNNSGDNSGDSDDKDETTNSGNPGENTGNDNGNDGNSGDTTGDKDNTGSETGNSGNTGDANQDSGNSTGNSGNSNSSTSDSSETPKDNQSAQESTNEQ